MPFPETGQLIFLRLPYSLPSPQSTIVASKSNGSKSSQNKPYHTCIVSQVQDLYTKSQMQLRVYVCRSFSARKLNPESWIREMELEDRKFMVPLQPSLQGPTDLQPPEGLESPITFLDYTLKKKTWVVAYDVAITLSKGASVSSLTLASTRVICIEIVFIEIV